MNLDSTAAFGAAMLAVGLGVVAVSARHAVRTLRLLAADGPDERDPRVGERVRVEGTVRRTDDAVTAPFTGRDCVAVEFDAEERRLGAYYLPTWVRVGGGRRLAAFVVDEKTGGSDGDGRSGTGGVEAGDGEYLVAGDSVVSLDRTASVRVGEREAPPDPIRDYRAETGGAGTVRPRAPSALRRFGLGDRRYLERRLDPGDRVTVVGRVADESGRIDPSVVSDATPLRTAARMSRQSLAGVAIGAFAAAVGAALLLV
ncbi:hypothetical protein NDI76_17175 [Halogeometricum sp. S1BR25-6]|uniref:RING-type E3 ubiquitin transferase n=1 Tax=Halogeometricum salsisoli TaxID=2950536 RepID=A0ABU2GI39_9EURY|nr:hypothetical protein [Halogeometricum sp. S1BR25-6]MDS0300483.1 hypothetical protein [Halogeometricum sp. S1BR25-6]